MSTRLKYCGSSLSSVGILLFSALVLVCSFRTLVVVALIELVVVLELVVEVADSVMSSLAEKAVELLEVVLIRYRDLFCMEVDHCLIGPLV